MSPDVLWSPPPPPLMTSGWGAGFRWKKKEGVVGREGEWGRVGLVTEIGVVRMWTQVVRTLVHEYMHALVRVRPRCLPQTVKVVTR